MEGLGDVSARLASPDAARPPFRASPPRSRLVLLCGSRKPHSSQAHQKSAVREFLRFLGQGLPEGALEVSFLDLRDFELPWFDGREPAEYASADLDRLSEALREADAIILGVPAYWGGVAGVVKNAIDVLSGPLYRGERASVLAGKLVGLLVVGAADEDAFGAAIQLRSILAATGAFVLPTQVVIGAPHQLRDPAKLSADIQALGAHIVDLVSAKREPKAPVSAPSIVELAFDTKAFNELAQLVLATLAAKGIPPPPDGWLDVPTYLRYQALVREHFAVPQTSITPLMARVLYGLSRTRRPRRIVGIGTYMGYALAWLLGPALAGGMNGFGQAVAIDVDAAATATARDNFHRLGLSRYVECVCDDGMRAIPKLGGPIDLLYIDVDSPDHGKKLYRPLLERAYPLLSQDAWVVAHDICIDQFKEDLAPYLALVRDGAYFSRSIALPFDFCGLEVSTRR